jgi:hypothetical protein
MAVASLVCFCISALLISWYPISFSDITFGIAYTLYIWLANAISFNSNRLALARNKPIERLGKGQYVGTSAFRWYMICFQILTVLAPLVTICLAPAEVAALAVSPLVLLLVQVANEALTHECHDVIRILVPIGFNTYRLFPLFLWVTDAATMSGGGPWHTFGLGLAIVNLLMWMYNLFIFLLLRTLPVYFDETYTPPIRMAYTLVPIPEENQRSA